MDEERGVDAGTVLADARQLRALEHTATAGLLGQAVLWADLHPALDPDDVAVATWQGRECGVPLAGAGTPAVDRACVSEFAAAVGLSSESGQRLIGDALELRHRLPGVWALVHSGRVPAWRARQLAQATSTLSVEAAAFVDRQIAAVAGQIGPRQLGRLVDAAVLEFMPAEAERRRCEAGDRRHFSVHHPGSDGAGRTEGGGGLSFVDGALDLADALDLDAAVAEGAAMLAAAGCGQSLDVRRSMALGELARRQPALQLGSDDRGPNDAAVGTDEPTDTARPGRTETAGTPEPANPTEGADTAASGNSRTPGSTVGRDACGATICGGSNPGASVGSPPICCGGRSGGGRSQVLLYLHLSADALGRPCGQDPDRAQVGWIGNTRTPVTASQIRDWCAQPDTRVEVKPVIDLNQNLSVEGYAIPDWLREHVTLRDRTCMFPWCHRPAHPRALRKRRRRFVAPPPSKEQDAGRKPTVQLDHTIPYGQGGPTSADNLLPLCQRHHNDKTHHRWRYRRLSPGLYLWTSPHGLRYLRDHHGTTALDAPPTAGPVDRRRPRPSDRSPAAPAGSPEVTASGPPPAPGARAAPALAGTSPPSGVPSADSLDAGRPPPHGPITVPEAEPPAF